MANALSITTVGPSPPVTSLNAAVQSSTDEVFTPCVAPNDLAVSMRDSIRSTPMTCEQPEMTAACSRVNIQRAACTPYNAA